jgi:hypothetical protein
LAATPPNVNFAVKPTAPASTPANGILAPFKRSDPVIPGVIPVLCFDQAAIGMMISTIAAEYPNAKPVGLWLSPRTIPYEHQQGRRGRHADGAAACPACRHNQPGSGLANANGNDVGASNLKIGTTSSHAQQNVDYLVCEQRPGDCNRKGCGQRVRAEE